MNSFAVSLSVLATAAAWAAPAPPPAPPATPVPTTVAQTEAWPDVVTLTRGTMVQCRILSASGDDLLIEYPHPTLGRQRPLSRKVLWNELRSADFAMDDEFHRLVAARDPVKDTPRAAARWAALVPLVSRPHHPAGDLALTLARLSLDHPDASARHRALAALQGPAAGDWNPTRRHQARLLQAQILAALGRTEEAVDEARRLATEPGLSAEAAMPALVMLAKADFSALQKLQDENPMWADDDLVRPEREALFHQALEAAIKPSVHHGALENPASQGLWTAVQLLEFNHRIADAADRARDLITLYPNSSLTADAASFLKRHRLPLDPTAAPEEPPPPATTTADTAAEPRPGVSRPEPAVQRRRRYADMPAGGVRTPPIPPAENVSIPTPDS